MVIERDALSVSSVPAASQSAALRTQTGNHYNYFYRLSRSINQRVIPRASLISLFFHYFYCCLLRRSTDTRLFIVYWMHPRFQGIKRQRQNIWHFYSKFRVCTLYFHHSFEGNNEYSVSAKKSPIGYFFSYRRFL